jgi:nucleoid-associated protein YgaU
MPIADGAHACPFVAFDDDRDERASVPDHRHRCYAEVRPAPRALAHQEAYCLSTAFPVCPTFQDWARRESARARDAAATAAAAAQEIEEVPEPPEEVLDPEPDSDDGDELPPAPLVDPEDLPRRNPPREWSAPPPWLASAEAASRGVEPSQAPDFLARRSEPGQGLAGSAADQLAGGSPPRPAQPTEPPPRHDRSESGSQEPPGRRDDPDEHDDRDLPRPAGPPRRPRAYDQHLGGPTSGPDWERPRRYEAYPTIRTRMGLPQVPRLGVMAAAIGIAALALFFLPAILGLGGGNQTASSPSPTARASQSLAPTVPPAPTPVVYVIKKGDTLSKIATANGLTLDELMAANPSIKDPNKIAEGQQITIPPPASQVPEEFGGSPSAAP